MPCPGCGITKSVLFFYEGDIYKSFSYHLLGPLAVAASVLMIILFSAEIITRKDYYNSFFSSKKLAYALGILLVGYHLVRTGYFIATHSFSDILHESIWM